MKSKICGISDSKTLIHLTNHSYPPQYIGFIVNYPKSKRFVPHEKLKQILNVDKKKSKYVAVLVNPNENILEEIKNLPFDYYQIYDCEPNEIKKIKENSMKRALRVDKMTVAALSALLNLYNDSKRAVQRIPTLRLLARNEMDIKAQAERLLPIVATPLKDVATVELTACQSQVGSGCLLYTSDAADE